MTVAQIFGLDQSIIGETNFELGFGSLLEGVCLGYSDECRVFNMVGMILFANTGLLCVGGVFVHVTANEVVVPNVGGALPRYDRIVARRDNSTNAVWIGVKEGTPAAAPVPPSLTRTGGIYEISLARVLIRAGAAVIVASDIVDERGEPSLCGYISFKAREHSIREIVGDLRRGGSWSAYARAAGFPSVNGTLMYYSPLHTENARAIVQDADGVAFQQDTSNVLNNTLYLESLGLVHLPSYGVIWECKFKLAQTTQERLFVGLTDASAQTPVSSDDVAVRHHAALQYSTSRPDTNFQFITKDGVTQQVIDTGVPVDTAAYVIRILLSSSAVTFELLDSYRNILARVRTTANLPSIRLRAWSGLRTLTTAVKTLYQYYSKGVNKDI